MKFTRGRLESDVTFGESNFELQGISEMKASGSSGRILKSSKASKFPEIEESKLPH